MAEVVARRTEDPGPAPGPSAVVAAVDGGENEPAVVTWAAAHAQRHALPLRLVHVVEVAVAVTPYEVLASEVPWLGEQLVDDARTRLGALADEIRAAHPDLVVDLDAPVGSPSAVLVDLSRDATVVVGAATHGRLERIAFGSTALAVVAHGHGTVVVVPEPLPPVLPRRVVVGAEGSPDGARAVAHAVAEAATVDGHVTVVTAWTVEVEDGVVVTEPGSERWARVEARLRDATRTALADARDAHPGVAVDVDVRKGSPVGALLAAADEHGADLVVVGRRGRGGFTGLLMGSVSRGVVQRAHVPVAVVR